MSDKTLDILDAIETLLTAETASGGTLEDVQSFFVLRTAADVPPDYGTMTPVLIVSPQAVSGDMIYLCSYSSRKTLPVKFSLFTENNGDTEDATAAELLDAIENVFTGNTFDLAAWWEFVSKDYSQVTIPAFSGDWNGAGEFICNYVFTDMRS